MVDTLMAIATWRHSVGDNSSNFFSAASYTLTWSIEGGLIDCDIYHSSAQWPAIKPTDVCSGSFSDLDARSREVCFAPMNGHRQTDPSRPKSANTGHLAPADHELTYTGSMCFNVIIAGLRRTT